MSKISLFTNWDYDAAKHLLSRTRLGYSESQLLFASSIPLSEFVDKYLLKDSDLPAPPGEWVYNNPDPLNSDFQLARLSTLIIWWMELLTERDYSIREKMTIFLHNHFTTEAKKVYQAERIYLQNQLLRKYSLGNFKELTKKITVDSAMLWYLDGIDNKKGSPNENYARELLELFTIGIGNYSQADIREAALALTGWTVDFELLEPKYDEKLFDNRTKSFLGATGNFNYSDIVDIIFSKPESAHFICEKICREFVDPDPDSEFVDLLSAEFVQNNFEIKPLLATLFKSEYFYSPEIRGCKIKSPIEFVLGVLNQLEAPNIDTTYAYGYVEKLEQILFNPPDVRGWLGHKKWINSTTFPTRNAYSDSIINGVDINGNIVNISIDILTVTERAYHDDINIFINNVIKFYFSVPLTSSRIEYLKEILLEGSPEYSWSLNEPSIEIRLKTFFKALFKLPEYQLS